MQVSLHLYTSPSVLYAARTHARLHVAILSTISNHNFAAGYDGVLQLFQAGAVDIVPRTTSVASAASSAAAATLSGNSAAASTAAASAASGGQDLLPPLSTPHPIRVLPYQHPCPYRPAQPKISRRNDQIPDLSQSNVRLKPIF